jgi:predicted metal-binding membrane protein
MWMAMMVPMMLPSLVPVLSRYRRSVRGAEGIQLHGLTALVGVGYFVIWAVLGAPAYAAGAGVMAVEMRWGTVAQWLPVAAGVVLLVAGGVQFTSWKARQLSSAAKGQGAAARPHPTPGARAGMASGWACGAASAAAA